MQGLLSLRHGTREDSQCGAQCKSEPALPDENAQSWHHGGNERHPLDPEPKQGRKSRDCTERSEEFHIAPTHRVTAKEHVGNCSAERCRGDGLHRVTGPTRVPYTIGATSNGGIVSSWESCQNANRRAPPPR